MISEGVNRLNFEEGMVNFFYLFYERVALPTNRTDSTLKIKGREGTFFLGEGGGGGGEI